MKKILVMLALAGVSMSSFAQDEVPVEKYSVATNSFGSNWFVELGADWNAWYSAEERGHDLAKSPFKKFRSNPGVSFAFGKWFTPSIGLRTKVQGIWGKKVDADWDEHTNDGNGNKYWVANEQVMFNLSNLFCGYSETRVWNLIPFAGAGIGRSMTYNTYALDYSAGIQSTWKVTNKINVFAEAGVNTFDHNIDNCAGASDQKWKRRCNNFYAEVGLTFKLGKGKWKKAPDMDAVNTLHQSELDALNANLADANAENERLQKLLDEQQPTQGDSASKTHAASAYANTPLSVFFNYGKSSIAFKKDLVNVEALAKYAKENGVKLVVNGYADSATGSASANQKLSQARAEKLAKELVKMGVDKDNIIVKANGGVRELTPDSYNRRATVQVAE